MAAVDGGRGRHRRFALPLLLLASLGGLLLPEPSTGVQLWALAIGVAVGLPHGALDQPAAAQVLGPRYGRWWPLPFLAFYLSLGGLVLLSWTVAPVAALALFLILSAAHFGLGDAEPRSRAPLLAATAHGLAILVVPSLFHQAEVARIFALLAPGGELLAAALAGPMAWGWGAAVLAYAAVEGKRQRSAIIELGSVVLLFAALPPLFAFALYFGVLHAPRATLAEAEGARRPVRSLLRAAALPALAAATIAILAILWLREDGIPASAAVVTTVFVGLAMLTVPHMALGAALRWVAGHSDKRVERAPA